MRVKISFLKAHGMNGLVPLHHQKLLSNYLQEIIERLPVKSENYTFSSLKGTSKVQNGQIRFLSQKITLVISAREHDFVELLTQKIFEKKTAHVGKLTLFPKSQLIIEDPEFKVQMRYVCISPIVPEYALPENTDLPEQPLDPSSQEFSDFLYNSVIDRLEKLGHTEEDLNSFAEFEVTPDKEYIRKLNESGKKFARFYKSMDQHVMMGYLLPFTLHAHPTVHKFIWDCGLGMYTKEGYGMIDIVPEENQG